MIGGAFLWVLFTAQNFEQRGFLDNQTVVYPQDGSNDGGHIVNNTLLRWEASYKLASWLTVSGSVDARTDTHRQVEREWRLDTDDRGIQRPAFSLRRLSATLHKGKFTAELGRQFIRWGKTDILNPTDRFAPKDYESSVVDSDFLGVTAARVTYESGADTVDVVWQPWFTPARIPLLNQRWSPPIPFKEAPAQHPDGSQYGVRWNHIATRYEYALCFFDGENYLPSFSFPPLQRYFPKLRLYGGDAAVPLPWVTVKGEAAYFTSPGSNSDEYVLYVVQLERLVKEWSFVGGYAGEAVTRSSGNPLQFAPDRGFARSFVGRAGLTIDANRSLSVDAVIRAAGSFVRFEYSQLRGQHWRTTAGFAWIRGDMTDFLGQYRRNSYGYLGFRYSF